MPKRHFLFELLIVALDAPAHHGLIVIMRSKAMSSGSVESQRFVGSFSPFGHSTTNPPDSSSVVPCPAARTRAKREVSCPLLPSRRSIVCQACFDRLLARSAAVAGDTARHTPVQALDVASGKIFVPKLDNDLVRQRW